MLACLILLPAGAATAHRENAMVPAQPIENSRVTRILADLDGGFSLYFQDGSIAHFNADYGVVGRSNEAAFQPIGTAYSQLADGSSTRAGHHELVLATETSQQPPAIPPEIMPLPDRCQILTGTSGSRLRVINGNYAAAITAHADADDAMWVAYRNQEIIRFGPDCRATRVSTETLSGLSGLASDPAEGAVYAKFGGNRLARLEDGGTRWLVELEGTSTFGDRLDTTATGDVMVSGRSSPSGLFASVTRIDPDGDTLWRWTTPWPAYGISQLEADGSSIVAVSANPSQAATVFALDAQGALLWQFDIASSQFRRALENHSGDGGIWFSTRDPNNWRNTRVARASVEDGFDWKVDLPDGHTPLAIRPGPTLITGSTDTVGTSGPWPFLWRIDLTGDGLVERIELPQSVRAPTRAGMRVSTGRHYSMTETGPGDLILAAYDDALQPAWEQSITLSPPLRAFGARMAAGAPGVCIGKQDSLGSTDSAGTRLQVQCRDRDQGAMLLNHFRNEIGSSGDLLLSFRPDNVLEAWSTTRSCAATNAHCNTRLSRITWRLDGSSPEFLSVSEHASSGVLNLRQSLRLADGSTALLWVGQSGHPSSIQSIDAAGQQVWHLQLADDWQPDRLSSRGDGVLLAGRHAETPGLRLLRLAPDGATRWSVVIPLLDPDAFAGSGQAHEAPGGWAIVRQARRDLAIDWISDADGAMTEGRLYRGPHQDTGIVEGYPHVMSIAAQPDYLAVLRAAGAAVRVDFIDLEDGDLLAVGTAPGVVTQFGSDLEIDEQNRVSAMVTDAGAGYPGRAIVRLALDPLRPAPSSPSEWRGAWFDPRLPGQGLLITTLPDGGVFAAWFTFSADGGHQPGELRWFTLQGGPPDADGVASLTLSRNRGGRFAQPPVTQAEPVGHARLWKTSEGGLQLIFRFDDGVEDTIDGGLDLAPLVVPGDQDRSGLWFDPAHSGQGLVLAGSVGSGPMFGGWFSYDPEGASNDPTSQHWFALQGDGALDESGGTSVAIIQTIGGRLAFGGTGNIHEVGTARLVPLACDHMQIEYSFAESEIAAAFSGISGVLNLERIGPCAD